MFKILRDVLKNVSSFVGVHLRTMLVFLTICKRARYNP